MKHAEIAIRQWFIRSLSRRSVTAQPHLPLELGETPTILFLRQDRLGDAIISTPLLLAIVKKYPKAKIVLLLGENNKGIVPLLPFSAEVFVYRKRLIADLLMLRKLRNRKIDVLVDLMDNPSVTSSILVSAISAEYAIGVEKENSSVYNVRVPLLDRGKYHISRRMAELAKPFGIDPESIDPRPILNIPATEKTSGRLGLIVSAGNPDRYLSEQTLTGIASGAIVKGLAESVRVYYEPNDKELARRIVAAVKNDRVELAPETKSFAEFARSLASCSVVVTPDTSAIHLCSAFSIPLVGVYPEFPPTLHYWTPVGVDFEMIVHNAPTLGSVDADEVLAGLVRLTERLHSNTSSLLTTEHVA